MEYRVLGMDGGLELRQYEDGSIKKVRPDGTKPEPAQGAKPALTGLAERVEELEGEVKTLRENLGELEGAFAELLARLPGDPEESQPVTEDKDKKADAEAVNPPKEDKKADPAPAPPKPPKG